jgi:glycosyltransferase involved in cell wall biosynthesis
VGVDLDFWRPLKNVDRHTHFAILSVGRLHAVKNYEFLIRACSELKNARLNFHCKIAGQGEEYDGLHNLIRDTGLQNEVELCGHVGRDKLRILYSQADVVVLTSHSEGIPQTLMEAMAMERVVLAPSITGIPELITDKHTGFLYQQNSSPDFLEKLVNIAGSTASLRRLGRQARQRIQFHFNRQRNLDAWAKDFILHLESTQAKESCHANPVLQQVQLSVQRDRSLSV